MRNKVERENSACGGKRRSIDQAYIRASPCSENAGFTLVEMLVVLVITAVMAAMMVVGIRQMQAWTQLEERQSVQLTLEAVADHISGELSGALLLPLFEGENEGFTPMKGTGDSLQFVAVIRTGFSTKGLRETWYATEPSSSGQILVRKSRPHRFLQQGEVPALQTDELYDGVTRLEFDYLMRDSEDVVAWLDTWTKQTQLPAAIRITIYRTVGRHELNASRTVSLSH